MRTDILERKEEILKWIEENRPKSFICKELLCKPETLNRFLKIFSINYSGNMGCKGYKCQQPKKTSLEYASKSHGVKSHILKNKLLDEKIRERKCEKCKLSVWNGSEIPLELHHIDGNRFNNEIKNLEILCPNCHAQMPNNSGKNIKHFKKHYFCPQCEEEFSNRGLVCSKCSKKNRRGIYYPPTNKKVIQPPPLDILIQDVEETTLTATGKKYGVSRTTIRNWINKLKIESCTENGI